MKIEFKNQARGLDFDRIDVELFLNFRAALLRFDQPVAKGYFRPVPNSLARIFLHRPDDVLGVFL